VGGERNCIPQFADSRRRPFLNTFAVDLSASYLFTLGSCTGTEIRSIPTRSPQKILSISAGTEADALFYVVMATVFEISCWRIVFSSKGGKANSSITVKCVFISAFLSHPPPPRMYRNICFDSRQTPAESAGHRIPVQLPDSRRPAELFSVEGPWLHGRLPYQWGGRVGREGGLSASV